MATQPNIRSQGQEASLTLVSTQWAKDMISDIRTLEDIAKLPVPDLEERTAITRAIDDAERYLQGVERDAAITLFAEFDVLHRQRMGVEQSDFQLKIYLKVIMRARIPQWALEQAIDDFLTGDAGNGFVPSPPELITQAKKYMGKARWKLRVYKTWLEQPDWLRPPPSKPKKTIEDWMIPPGEVEEYNMLMRKFRLKMRVNEDGWPYMLV
jgi:hypothetical protein